MGHTYRVNSIVIHSSGTHAVSASSDNTVRLWQLSDKQTIAIFQHASSVFCAAFSANGRLILSGGYDKRVGVWTAPKGTLPADATSDGKETMSKPTPTRAVPKVQEPDSRAGSPDPESPQSVSTTASSDSESQQSSSTTVQSVLEAEQPIVKDGCCEVQQSIADEQSVCKAEQSVLEAERNLPKALIESDSKTGSPDSKYPQPILTDFKSQQFLSTTPSFDSRSQRSRSSSTTVQPGSKAEQSLSNECVSEAEQCQISKAEQSPTKTEQSFTEFERSVVMGEQAVSKTLVITTAELLAITQTIRTASITGDLSTAEKVLTQEITADAKNFASYANRSFVMARKLDWENAFQDANKPKVSPSVENSLSRTRGQPLTWRSRSRTETWMLLCSFT
ncbi:hypothetical protein EV702DRAFT_634073 [Suillus placidus]|uniref:Uncharacterized protein n=1 Tax=Suillus placidus TaxID=48579 RepID=A0A9P6ZMI9_9AGAM|nr:hypothetical protein EV702DRAFT_634073 [Suillus placidus]